MNKLYKIKEMLMDELEKYGDEKELSAGTLTVIDTLTHSIKNLCKVIEDMKESGEYSEGMYGPMYRGTSYARGRTNAKRDSMGRYSRNYSMEYSRAADDVIGQLEAMMDTAPDEKSRRKIRELISEMKNV
jgi:hypothetical protein